MTYQLFHLPKAVLHADAVLKPGWKVSFFLSTTTTPTPVYTTSALSVAHTQPVEADAAGVLAPIYLNPSIAYKASVYDEDDVLQYTVDPVNDAVLSQGVIGALLYPQTAAETAAGVTPTNYAYPPGDVRRYGAVGDGVANDYTAISTALASGEAVYVPPGSYLISTSTLTISRDDSSIKVDAGATITYSGTDAAVRFSGVRDCDWAGAVNIVCTDTAAMGVDFQPTATNNCLFNRFEFHTIQGAGRGAAFATLSNIGIRFDQYNAGGNKIVYWNEAKGRRIIDFNTCVQFDAPNSDAANGANGNRVADVDVDNYWKGVEYRSIECFAVNVSGYGSPGSGADTTYLHYIANGSFYNQVSGGGGEPGSLGAPYYVTSGCNYNSIDMQVTNFAAEGVDLGDGNQILTGRSLYSTSLPLTTGDALTENTNYRFGKVTLGNTSAATVRFNWSSRNSANGYYTSGVAEVLAWNQGGVTVEKVTTTFQESGATATSQTRFIGVIVSGNDIFFVFSVKSFGGANATTRITIDLDCLNAEPRQTGPTTEAGSLTVAALTKWTHNKSLADDGTVALPLGVAGYGSVSSNAEMMLFQVQSDGTVTKVSGTTNTEATDSDGDLCVYDSGSGATIKNRLGSGQIVRAEFTF